MPVWFVRNFFFFFLRKTIGLAVRPADDRDAFFLTEAFVAVAFYLVRTLVAFRLTRSR